MTVVPCRMGQSNRHKSGVSTSRSSESEFRAIRNSKTDDDASATECRATTDIVRFHPDTEHEIRKIGIIPKATATRKV